MRQALIRIVMRASVFGLWCATLGQFNVAAQDKPMSLADMHFHALQNVSPREALKEMDRAGVRWAGSGARGMDDFWFPYVEAAPDRFVPFAGQGQIATIVGKQGEAAWKLTSPIINQYLKVLEQNLKSGRFRGIGEIIINNVDSGHPVFPGAHYPVDSPLVRHLFGWASTYQVPLSFHVQADPDSLQEMERLLAQDPKVAIIWCHAGSFASAWQVGQFMDRYPNFYADLAVRDDRRRGPRIKTESIVVGSRHLKGDWKALLEKYSNRFFIGTDMLDDMTQYQAIIGFFRDVVAQLSPQAAQRIGYENAQRLFRLAH